MTINIRAFAVAFGVFWAVLLLAISVWTRVSPEFGRAFMAAYNSVHPHPFLAGAAGLGLLEHSYGVALDVFYAGVDSLVFALGFGSLYNRLARDSSANDVEEEP